MAACNDSFPIPPDVPPTKSNLTITTGDITPALVAFQDGFNQPWANATKTDNTHYAAVVENPFRVLVVCNVQTTTANDTWRIWELADVAGDDEMVPADCPDPAPAMHTVTGMMPSAGVVSLGSATMQDLTATAPWAFSLSVPDGTYDLVAATTTKWTIKANVTVNGADLAEGTIDFTSAKTLVDPGTFIDNSPITFPDPDPTVTDPDNEAVTLLVQIQTKNNGVPATISVGDCSGTNSAGKPTCTAKAIATADLPTDLIDSDPKDVNAGQQITMTGTYPDPVSNDPKTGVQTLTRTTNRLFQAGDTDDFPLNIPLPTGWGSVVWFADPTGLSMIGDSDPPDDETITALGTTTDGKIGNQTLTVTSDYLLDTSVARLVLDTDVPGFQGAWKIDFTKKYDRSTFGEARDDDETTDPETHDNRSWASDEPLN